MNLIEGLTNMLESETPESQKVAESLGKKVSSDVKSLDNPVGVLVDYLQELETDVQSAGQSFGWEFRFTNPSLLVEYFEQAYSRLQTTIQDIANKHGYHNGVEAEVTWIPREFHDDNQACVDDTIGEWHFSVSYKNAYLFGITLTPLMEDSVAYISEEVEESLDVSAFGFEANPYVFINGYDEMVQFLNVYFENADMVGANENEMDRRKNNVYQMWVGPDTEEAVKVVEEVVKPALEKEGFESYSDSFGSILFRVAEIDKPKAESIVKQCSEHTTHLFCTFNHSNQ